MPRSSTLPPGSTVADLVERLGHIPAHRIRLDPPPGRATEKDLLHLLDHENRLFELGDGVLVEKPMGLLEAGLAGHLIGLMDPFVFAHDLGFVAGADATLRLLPGLVRMPDVAFISWHCVGRKEYPREPIPNLAPDLAVEVLSESNTEGEMERKLKEYFLAGVRLVWLVDPVTRAVRVYTAPDQVVRLTEEQSLTGGDVLPGLELPLRQVFARVPRDLKPPSRKRTSRKKKS